MIVCATREICFRPYEEIVTLRPDWHSTDLHKGVTSCLPRGATDTAFLARHVQREKTVVLVKELLAKIDAMLRLAQADRSAEAQVVRCRRDEHANSVRSPVTPGNRVGEGSAPVQPGQAVRRILPS